MKKKIEEMTIEELRTRAAEIRTAAADTTLEQDALTELEKEADAIAKRIAKYDAEQRRRALADKMTATGEPVGNPASAAEDETRANRFIETRSETISTREVRSTLMSSGNLAAPTAVSGINDTIGAKVSSIVDLVKIVNCEGMRSNVVAFVKADAEAASTQTEGGEATVTEASFGTVTISPESVAALSYISKQARKQSPLLYEAKVREQSMISLRKSAAALLTKQLKASKLNTTVKASVASSKGIVDASTLRKLALAYGGDESIVGGAVLFLHKQDLIAFGDVRGTNEKKPVYEITPDTGNPNTGVIKDGGLSVRYCLNSNLTPCSGTAQISTAQKTMFYGVPTNLELDLFSPYEITVSSDFAFNKLMETILGDVEMGADVVAQDGFVALEIAGNG